MAMAKGKIVYLQNRESHGTSHGEFANRSVCSIESDAICRVHDVRVFSGSDHREQMAVNEPSGSLGSGDFMPGYG
jgi:hypothetical protein